MKMDSSMSPTAEKGRPMEPSITSNMEREREKTKPGPNLLLRRGVMPISGRNGKLHQETKIVYIFLQPLA